MLFYCGAAEERYDRMLGNGASWNNVVINSLQTYERASVRARYSLWMIFYKEYMCTRGVLWGFIMLSLAQCRRPKLSIMALMIAHTAT